MNFSFIPLGLPTSQLQKESKPSENEEKCDSLLDDDNSDYSSDKENSLFYKKSNKVSQKKCITS